MKIAGIAQCRRGSNKMPPDTSADILANDPIMQELMAVHPPSRIGQNPVFFSLVRAIISQQLSESAAATNIQETEGFRSALYLKSLQPWILRHSELADSVAEKRNISNPYPQGHE